MGRKGIANPAPFATGPRNDNPRTSQEIAPGTPVRRDPTGSTGWPEAVVHGRGPTALGAVRSLAREKIPVGWVSLDAADPVMHSRLARHKHVFAGDVMTAGAEF